MVSVKSCSSAVALEWKVAVAAVVEAATLSPEATPSEESVFLFP